MSKNFLILFLITIFLGCNKTKKQSNYNRHIGDIEYNASVDDKTFKICDGEDNTMQYFSLQRGLPYKGEKKALEKIFKKKYSPVNSNQTGLIRIRFIVNCKGELGRFRVIQMNENYEKEIFNSKIVNQLLTITKNLDGWRRFKNIDYYQYLIFRIDKGSLIEILP